MTKRIALLAGTALLLASLAMTAIASARPSRHGDGHGAVKARATSVQPDQVIQWNQELQRVLVASGAQPASIHPTRTMAVTQIAVYDAVNGIVGGGQPFLVDLHGPRSASAEAAAAAAARTALDALLPRQQSAIDSFFQTSLAQIGSGEHVDRGVRFGEEVADALLAARANDGARSEEHTSELQSRRDLVCRLLLEKK